MMTDENFKHIVRIANTDLDGNKNIAIALRKIKGVGINFANALCVVSKVDKNKKTGYLSDAEIDNLSNIVKEPKKFNIPVWMLNRRRNYEDDSDKHLLISDLNFTKDNDIKRMRKIKSYKGVRHGAGLPLRGQRTKSNFRKNKGKVAGVKRKKGKSGRT